MIVPFPRFEPDKSDFNPSAGDGVLNCLPVADGWGPMASLVEQSAALPSEPLGAVFVRKANGETTIIAGTETNLYKLNTSTNPYSWDEISKSTDAYSVPISDKWQFTVFGDYLIACSLGGPPQFFDIEAGTNFADLTGAPTARYVWTAGDFVVFGYLDGEPNKVRWSGLNDAEYWTSGQRGADEQVIPTGGEIMGGIGDQRGSLILMRDAMKYMQFAPESRYTFTFSDANTKRGVVAAHSIVQIGQNQFAYLSEDGFFSNLEGTPIGAEKVDRWFLNELDRDYLFDVKGMADPFNKIVWWRYRNTQGQNRLIGYDWQLSQWCYSDEQILEAAALASPALSWDALALQYASIDDVDVPFNSLLFQGGRPVFAGFNSNNKLVFAGGSNLAATLETSWVEPNQGKRAFLNEGRLIGDASTFTVAAGRKDFHSDDPEYKTAVSPSTRTGRLPLKADARLHRQRLAIPAGEIWEVVTAIDLNFVGSGQL